MADIKLTALPAATSLALTDILLVTKSPGGAAASNKVTVSTLLNTTAWTDYSATSTIVGWSSFTIKNIYYKKIGTLVFCSFALQGVSNSTTTTFTLPDVVNAAAFNMTVPLYAGDNSVQVSTAIAFLTAGSATIACYPTGAGGGWTASNTKSVRGQFFYEV